MSAEADALRRALAGEGTEDVPLLLVRSDEVEKVVVGLFRMDGGLTLLAEAHLPASEFEGLLLQLREGFHVTEGRWNASDGVAATDVWTVEPPLRVWGPNQPDVEGD